MAECVDPLISQGQGTRRDLTSGFPRSSALVAALDSHAQQAAEPRVRASRPPHFGRRGRDNLRGTKPQVCRMRVIELRAVDRAYDPEVPIARGRALLPKRPSPKSSRPETCRWCHGPLTPTTAWSLNGTGVEGAAMGSPAISRSITSMICRAVVPSP